MSAEGFHDWEADEVGPSRDASRTPDVDARDGRDPEPGRDREVGRAFGELASENAELYRRNAEQDKRIGYLEAQLTMGDARFEAWTREMGRRDEARTSRIEQLEHALAERSADPGSTEHRIGERAAPDDEKKSGHERERGRPSNEAIAVGIAVGGIVLSAVGDAIGTPAAADVTGIAGGVLMAGATGLAWMRKLREGKDGDRS